MWLRDGRVNTGIRNVSWKAIVLILVNKIGLCLSSPNIDKKKKDQTGKTFHRKKKKPLFFSYWIRQTKIAWGTKNNLNLSPENDKEE